jgi:hypothetical protein
MSNDDQLERQIERWEEQRREHLERMKDVPLPEGMRSFVDVEQRDGTYKREYSPLTEEQQEFVADIEKALGCFIGDEGAEDLTIIGDALDKLRRKWGEPVE